jgi:hypothetical protein
MSTEEYQRRLVRRTSANMVDSETENEKRGVVFSDGPRKASPDVGSAKMGYRRLVGWDKRRRIEGTLGYGMLKARRWSIGGANWKEVSYFQTEPRESSPDVDGRKRWDYREGIGWDETAHLKRLTLDSIFRRNFDDYIGDRNWKKVSYFQTSWKPRRIMSSSPVVHRRLIGWDRDSI